MPQTLSSFLLFFLVLAGLWANAQATTKYWIGGRGKGKDWTLGTNWKDGNNTIGNAPVAGDDIVFNDPAPEDSTIIFSKMPGNVSYKSLTILRHTIRFRSFVTPCTLTIGGNVSGNFGGGVNTDFFVNGYKSLELDTTVNINLAPNSKAVIIGQLIIRSLSTFNASSSGSVTEVTGELNNSYKGYIINQGNVTSSSSTNLVFNENATYQHWRNKGQVPWATWNSTSNCIIYLADTAPDADRFAQAFGNLEWNCKPNLMSVNATLAPYLKTVNGNLNIRQTGSSEYPSTNYLLISNPSTGTLTIKGTLTIGGFVHIDGGTVNASGGTSIARGFRYAGAYLTMNGGIFNTPYLTVGPHNTFSGESAYFNTGTGINILGGILNINDALTISENCVFRCTNSPTINIKGNMTNKGSYLKDGETVTFNGNNAQSIGGTSVTTFYNLNINNAAGISLQQDARVWNTLTFTSGKITTGTKTLMLDVNATPVSGAGNGKYVFGNLGICIPANTNSVTFTIGDASAYTPVTLAFSGTPTNTIGNIIASTKTGKHPNIATTGIYGVDSTKSLNRYFTLTNNGTTFGTCSATFKFINPTDLLGAADPLIFIVQRFAPNSWYPTIIGTRTTTTTQITGLLQTDFGDFQAGQMKCTAPVNNYTVTGGGSYCVGNTGAEVGLSNSQAGVVYQLRVNGANTGSPVPGGGSSISFGNQATPGTYTVLATRVIGGCYSTMNNSVSIP